MTKTQMKRVFIRGTWVIVLTLFMSPILWILYCSFSASVLSGVPNSLSLSIDNHVKVFQAGLPKAAMTTIVTSFIIASLSVGASLVFATCTVFRGRFGISILVNVAAWRLLPAAFFVLPQAYLIKALPSVSPLVGFVALVSVQLIPLSTLILAPFIIRAHSRFWEAARMDGASEWYYSVRILTPQVSVACIFAFSITFLLAWCELFTPSVLITSRDNWTLPIFLSQYITSYSTFWGELYAAAAQTAILGLALAAVFNFTLSKIIQSLSNSSVTQEIKHG